MFSSCISSKWLAKQFWGGCLIVSRSSWEPRFDRRSASRGLPAPVGSFPFSYIGWTWVRHLLLVVRGEAAEHLFLASCEKSNVLQAQMLLEQRDFPVENLCGNIVDAISFLVSFPNNASRLSHLKRESPWARTGMFLWTKPGNCSFSCLRCWISLVGLETSHPFLHLGLICKQRSLWAFARFLLPAGGSSIVWFVVVTISLCLLSPALIFVFGNTTRKNVLGKCWLPAWYLVLQQCSCVVVPLVLSGLCWQLRREIGLANGWAVFVQRCAQADLGSELMCSARALPLAEVAALLLLPGEGSLHLKYFLYSSFEHLPVTKAGC